jgi:hypothetical protein
MFLCFYGNVLITSFTVILRPLDYGRATRGNQSLSVETEVNIDKVTFVVPRDLEAEYARQKFISSKYYITVV